MSASATDSRRMRRSFWVCLLIAGFCFLLNAVYTSFSYGESSAYMAGMFQIPLAGGAFPALLMMIGGWESCISRSAFNAWNSGLAALTVGCAVRGVINISGRSTQYDAVYGIAGAVLLAIAVALTIFDRVGRR